MIITKIIMTDKIQELISKILEKENQIIDSVLIIFLFKNPNLNIDDILICRNHEKDKIWFEIKNKHKKTQ